MNTPVNFEIAKLLKEKGFDEKVRMHYESNGNRFYDNFPCNFNNVGIICSAPTIAEVVMWLYEKHGIWVYVECDTYGKDWFPKFNSASKQVWEDDDKVYKIKSNRLGWYKSPTEAYEAAITYTLNNLI